MIIPSSVNVMFAQDTTTVTTAVTDQIPAESSGIDWAEVQEIIIAAVFLLAILFILGHMIYVRYIKKPLATYEVSDFKEIRKNAAEAMPAIDAKAMLENINAAIALFSTTDYYDDGEEFLCVSKNSEMKKALATYEETVAAAPENEEVVDALNELANHINENNVRHHFHGSKALIWVSGIVGLIVAIIMFCSDEIWGGVSLILFFGVSIFLYIIACQGPAWLMAKRLRNQSGHASNGIIAGVFGMIAGAKTVRTVTKYDDGSKEVSDDHSEHFAALIVALFVFIVIAFTLSLFSLWNYLRNYVFYF